MPELDLPREPMSHVDAAWLRMDTPENLMIITGLLQFEEPLGVDDLVAMLEERLLRHERFTQRAVPARVPLARPQWELDLDFDLRNHVHRVALKGPDQRRALEDLVGQLMGTPLHRGRPLWEVHLVERFEGGSALIVRIHHSVGDGIALVRLLLGLADGKDAAPPPQVGVRVPPASHLWQWAKDRLTDVATLGKMLILPADRRTLLRAPLGRRKLAAFSDPLALAQVKSIAAAASGTVNDVLAACVAGALRRYLRGRGSLPKDLAIRALVPVYVLEGGPRAGSLGNHFGLVFLPLPVGIEDPLERLRSVKRAMDAIKCSSEALVALAVLDVTGATSTEVERIVIDVFTRKASLLMTNVPGPRERVLLAGRRIRGLMFWAPTSGHLGLSVSVLSYGGEVRLMASGDARLLPDPRELTDGFVAELAALQQALDERREAAGLTRLPPPAPEAPRPPASGPRPRGAAR
ncbi:MAG TPA: WS/DGAT domain-containing protein, partial [Polyangia bacterium]